MGQAFPGVKSIHRQAWTIRILDLITVLEEITFNVSQLQTLFVDKRGIMGKGHQEYFLWENCMVSKTKQLL